MAEQMKRGSAMDKNPEPPDDDNSIRWVPAQGKNRVENAGEINTENFQKLWGHLEVEIETYYNGTKISGPEHGLVSELFEETVNLHYDSSRKDPNTMVYKIIATESKEQERYNNGSE